MKLWIPHCGNAFRLTENWTFTLLNESRNDDLWKATGQPEPTGRDGRWQGGFYSRNYRTANVTIPSDTVLVVDRVYIRQNGAFGHKNGKNEFNSITFLVRSSPDPTLVTCRFWAKLDDINTIMCEPIDGFFPIGQAGKAEARALTEGKDVKKAREERKAKKAKVEKIKENFYSWVEGQRKGQSSKWIYIADTIDKYNKFHREKVKQRDYPASIFSPWRSDYAVNLQYVGTSYAKWNMRFLRHLEDGTEQRRFYIDHYDAKRVGWSNNNIVVEVTVTTDKDGNILKVDTP